MQITPGTACTLSRTFGIDPIVYVMLPNPDLSHITINVLSVEPKRLTDIVISLARLN